MFQTNFCKDNFQHVVILGAYLAAYGDQYGNEQDCFNAAMNLYFTNAFFQSGCQCIVNAAKDGLALYCKECEQFGHASNKCEFKIQTIL